MVKVALALSSAFRDENRDTAYSRPDKSGLLMSSARVLAAVDLGSSFAVPDGSPEQSFGALDSEAPNPPPQTRAGADHAARGEAVCFPKAFST